MAQRFQQRLEHQKDMVASEKLAYALERKEHEDHVLEHQAVRGGMHKGARQSQVLRGPTGSSKS